MSTRRRLLSAVGITVLLCIAASFSRLHAADDPPPAQGIQISPVLVDLNAEKSNSYSIKITVTNVTAGQLVLKAAVNDFKAKDESGNPEVILDDKDEDPTYSFKNWVVPIPSLTLKAKESRVVSVSVNVPTNAESGGHYGVIRFSGSPPGQADSNVSIAASVGVLVLARVNGTITEKLSLKDFYVEKGGKRASLAQNGPLSIMERIQNDGNVHVKPTGTITVKNMFGSTLATLPLSDPARNILPKSTRKLSQDIKQKWLFGRYTARLDATYGYTNSVLTGSFSFWVIPYRLMLIVLITIVALVFLLRFLIRRYNQKIIAKANNNSGRRR